LTGVAAAALPLIAVLGATPVAAASKPTAAQLLNQGVTAANEAGTMSFADHSTEGKTTQTLTGAISAPTALESLNVTGQAPFQVMLVGQVIYVRAGAPVLQGSLGLPAAASTANAGKWISVQSGDSAFETLAGGLTLSSELNTYIPASQLHEGKVITVSGTRAIPISGRPSTSVLGTGKKGSAVLREVAGFSNWGNKVTLTAPTGAVPFSSLVAQ
jgi:hypothetical protein